MRQRWRKKVKGKPTRERKRKKGENERERVSACGERKADVKRRDQH